MGQVLSLEQLKEKIRAIEGSPRVAHTRAPSGVACIDELVGGLVRPGLLELTGAPGSGAVKLALDLVAAENDQRRRVAWIDGEHSLYPPAAADRGVDLDRLLIVRPPAAGNRGGQHPDLWAIEQVLRSGCFRLVVATTACKLPRFAGTRWRQAAEQGACSAVLITRQQSRNLQPDVRLQVGPRHLVVGRDRQRGPGAIYPLGRRW